jgi:ATP-binding cassette subfamily D (ALD) protein 3
MFVPQKPYQVVGTLRDQIIYPHDRAQMTALGVTDTDLCRLIQMVDPAQSILGQWQLDDVRNWINAFSGGQKQRIAMARVFYHRPLYAILDECTSAVSDEVEGLIYTTCKTLGITIFTVSHRPSLQVYHDHQLRFDGFGAWSYTASK